jgi:hypothetical protein
MSIIPREDTGMKFSNIIRHKLIFHLFNNHWLTICKIYYYFKDCLSKV